MPVKPDEFKEISKTIAATALKSMTLTRFYGMSYEIRSQAAIKTISSNTSNDVHRFIDAFHGMNGQAGDRLLRSIGFGDNGDGES